MKQQLSHRGQLVTKTYSGAGDTAGFRDPNSAWATMSLRGSASLD